MAQQEFYTILTSAGLAYEANRKSLGLPIKLTEMSVGDGNGAVYNPAATQTALRREVWRGPINALLQDATNPSYLVGELSLPDDVGGWYVREVGFWTESGILYAIGKYPESFKPQLASGAGKEFYIRAIFETSNAESVTLVVDDTVVKATRAYVIDYVAAELAKRDSKNSVRVATTGAIALSGAQSIDGVAVVAGDRVLVKNQANGAQNGIYLAAVGVWSRAADADASIEVTPGLLVPVEEGTANGDSVWQLVTNAPITLGTSALAFELLAGRTGIAAGAYTSVTVDKYGRVIAGTNPTTVAGYGITDALKIGDHGIGGNLKTFTGNIDDPVTVPLGWCFLSVPSGTSGTLPSGANYGILKTVGFRNDQMLQIFSIGDGVAGKTTASFYRTGFAGRPEAGPWGPWLEHATTAHVATTVAAELEKLDSKQSVRVATTAPITLSGLQTLDGIVLAAGDRVLVKDQAAPAQNGIYLAASGSWARAADADASLEVTAGMLVPVESGTVNGDSLWQMVTDGIVTLGATALAFEMLGGLTGAAAGTFRSVTVDKRGRVTGGTNPTTLAGYGITDALKIGDNGIGGDLKTFAGDIDDMATVPLGWCFVSTSTTGTKPSPYGILHTVGFRGDQILQVFTVASSAGAVTNKQLYRTGYLSWGPWVEILSGQNIATQEATDAGAADDKVVSPKKLRWGFAALFNAAAGYLRFPTWLGGFTLQWGKVTNSGAGAVYTFPIAFASECYGVQCSADANYTGQLEIMQPSYITATGFTAYAAYQPSGWVVAHVTGWYFAYGK